MHSPSPSLTARFAAILDLLSSILLTRTDPRRMAGAVLVPVWSLVRSMSKRLARVAARLQAGTPPRATPVRSAVKRAPRLYGVATVLLEDGWFDRVPPWVSDRAGWLTDLSPEAAECADQLRELLAEPGLAALAASSPGITRLLRSACRMLGVDPRPALPPRPARPRRPAVYLPMHYGLGPPPKWASRRGMLVRRGGEPD